VPADFRFVAGDCFYNSIDYFHNPGAVLTQTPVCKADLIQILADIEYPFIDQLTPPQAYADDLIIGTPSVFYNTTVAIVRNDGTYFLRPKYGHPRDCIVLRNSHEHFEPLVKKDDGLVDEADILIMCELAFKQDQIEKNLESDNKKNFTTKKNTDRNTKQKGEDNSHKKEENKEETKNNKKNDLEKNKDEEREEEVNTKQSNTKTKLDNEKESKTQTDKQATNDNDDIEIKTIKIEPKTTNIKIVKENRNEDISNKLRQVIPYLMNPSNKINYKVDQIADPDKADIIKRSQCISDEQFNKFNRSKYEMMKGESCTMTLDKTSITAYTPYNKTDLLCTKHHEQPGLFCLLAKPKVASNSEHVIIYTDCPKNTLTTAKRMLDDKTNPDPKVGDAFVSFVEGPYKQNVIDPMVEEFKYCPKAWYNTLTQPQQQEVGEYVKELKQVTDKPSIGGAFIKMEKQLLGEKTRQIYGPDPMDKYILGPVMKALDPLFKKYQPGWGVGYTYQEKEEWLNKLEEDEYDMSITLDISGMDKSHNNYFRTPFMLLMEELIIKKKITHVNENIFRQAALRSAYTISYTTTEDKRNNSRSLCLIKTNEKLPSGVNMTTDINTQCMLAVIQFMEYHYKIELRAKGSGDDVGIGAKRVQLDTIKQAFSELFPPAGINDLPHGIGLVLKYLRIGKIEDLTICSTELFKCPQCGYKMIRMLDRYMRFSIWSRKCLGLSKAEILQYCRELSLADEKWANGLPIFRALMDRFRYPEQNIVLKKGKPKEILETDFVSNGIYEENRVKDDFGWEAHLRISDKKKCCIEAWVDRLEKKYGITPSDIETIEDNIKEANHLRGFDNVRLSIGFEHAEGFIDRLNVDIHKKPKYYLDKAQKYATNLIVDGIDKTTYTTPLSGWANLYAIFWIMVKANNIKNQEEAFDQITKALIDSGLMKTKPLLSYNKEIIQPLEKHRLNLENFREAIKFVTKGYRIFEIEHNELPSLLDKSVYYSVQEGFVSRVHMSQLNNDDNKDRHEHVCVHCNQTYTHSHPYKKNHPQFPKQCPYENCSNYESELPRAAKIGKIKGIPNADEKTEYTNKNIKNIKSAKIKETYYEKNTYYDPNQNFREDYDHAKNFKNKKNNDENYYDEDYDPLNDDDYYYDDIDYYGLEENFANEYDERYYYYYCYALLPWCMFLHGS
jgi:hypothetical protein